MRYTAFQNPFLIIASFLKRYPTSHFLVGLFVRRGRRENVTVFFKNFYFFENQSFEKISAPFVMFHFEIRTDATAMIRAQKRIYIHAGTKAHRKK